MFINLIYPEDLSVNSKPHKTVCTRCGGEIYSGECAVRWEGIICPDCLREKLRRMTDCQLAQLLELPYFIIK